MAKKIQLNKSIIHNVYLLYFLFIATLLHLGYFLFTKENVLIASFSIAVLFLYLVNPNMVIVLGVSLIFVDLLYLVQKVPEGFDSSGVDISGIRIREGFDSSGIDLSGVDISGTRIREKFTDKDGQPLTITNLFNKVKELQETDNDSDLRNAVNTMVGAKGVIKEKLTENSIEEVDKQSSNVKSMINTVKEMTPELSESLKSINTIDINELNKLINNLNSMTKGLNKDGV